MFWKNPPPMPGPPPEPLPLLLFHELEPEFEASELDLGGPELGACEVGWATSWYLKAP